MHSALLVQAADRFGASVLTTACVYQFDGNSIVTVVDHGRHQVTAVVLLANDPIGTEQVIQLDRFVGPLVRRVDPRRVGQDVAFACLVDAGDNDAGEVTLFCA